MGEFNDFPGQNMGLIERDYGTDLPDELVNNQC